MKIRKYLFLIAVISVLFSCKAERELDVILWHDTDPIPVFDSPTAISPVEYLLTFSSFDNLSYYATIINESPLRFKLRIGLWDGPNLHIGEKDVWINKTDCKCFVLVSEYIDGNPIIHLYKSPEGECKKIIDTIDGDLTAIVLEMKVDGDQQWANVMFSIDDIQYVGWVKRFCTSSYGCN